MEKQTTEELLAERGRQYGHFKDGAEIMQHLKRQLRNAEGWNNLTHAQCEALDMICHKIGRILNGDPNIADHWDDISGYSTLCSMLINGENP